MAIRSVSTRRVTSDSAISGDATVIYSGATNTYTIGGTAASSISTGGGGGPVIGNVQYLYANNTVIVGTTSNAHYTVASTDTLGDFSEEDIFDNKLLQSEADAFTDFSEINPFGTP